MDYEASDILGGDLPIAPDGSSGLFAQAQDLARKSLLVSLTSVALYVALRVYLQWTEKSRVLKTRRAYGIPDDDHRPFNVALAAVKSERDAAAVARRKQGKEKHVEDVSTTPLPATNGQAGQPHLRQRFAQSYDAQSPAPPVQSSFAHVMPGNVQSAMWRSILPSYVTTDPPALMDETAPHVYETPGAVRRKHSRDEDGRATAEHEKGRVDEDNSADETPDLDTDDDGMEVDEELPHRRGAKRSAESEEDEAHTPTSRYMRRDKRARKVSHELSVPEEDTEMSSGEDTADESMDVDPGRRGLKRNRADAGSTIGEGSFNEDADEEGKSRRRTRRRTISKKTETTRGQKRVREAELDTDGESDGHLQRGGSRKKLRGKRGLAAVNEDLGEYSNDPLCKGRRIGEEWEANGVCYKVGPNGQRLRQELVKKSRTIFRMPTDSQHPDRGANIPVYVETWLGEEEYKSAKEHGELAWQDPPKDLIIETAEDDDIPGSPWSGKSLLYEAVAASSDGSGPKKGPFKQSMSAGAIGLRVDGLRQSSLGRRLSSPYQAPAPPLPAPETPAKPVRASKSYSKWEKQDLEAAAMNRIREKALQAARAEEERKAKEAASQAAAAAPTPATAASTSQVSSIAFPKPGETKPAEKPLEQPKAPGTGVLGVPPVSGTSSSANPPAVPKLAIPGATSTQPMTETSKPPNFFAIAPAPAANAVASTPATAFAAPATVTAAPAPTSSLAVPNFFGAKGNTSAPATSSTTSSTNTFGASSATPSTQAGGASQFTFGAPAVPITTASQDASQKTGQPAQPVVPSGGSLLSRLGPASTPAQPAAPASATTPATFTFGKPSSLGAGTSAITTSSQPSPFGGAAAPTPVAGSTSTSNAPAFGFGTPSATSTTAGSKPPASPFGAAPATSSAPAAASSTPSAFGFGSSSTPTQSFGTSNASAAPKLTLGSSGTPASSSAFNFGGSAAPTAPSTSGGSAFAASANGSAKPAASNKFTFGSSSGSTSSPFGAATSTPSPFGNASSSSAAPKAQSPFGGGAGTPMASASTPAAGSSATDKKPSFSFNFGSAPAAGTSAPSSSSSFTFGPTPAGASNTSSTAAATPAAFGFGAPSSTTSSAPSTFGAPSAFSAPGNFTNTGASNPFNLSGPACSGSFTFGSSSNPSEQKK